MKKKVLIAVVVLVMVCGIMLTFVGCDPLDPWQYEGTVTEGDWVYEKVSETVRIDKSESGEERKIITIEGARIIGPTKEARLKERLVIPIEIGGLPVIQVGKDVSEILTEIIVRFDTIKTKKIILPWQLGYLKESDHFIFSSEPLAFGTAIGIRPKIVYSNIKYSSNYITYYESEYLSYSQFRYVLDGVNPNMIFYYNYEKSPNEDICWADDNEVGEEIIMPEYPPTREGYEFDGWYCEAECINKFEEKVKGETELKLFAKWNINNIKEK